jgi:subtilisin family serine protease
MRTSAWKIVVTAVMLIGGLLPLVSQVQAAEAHNFVVLYKQEAVPADATVSIAKAGGTVVASYPAIGVVIASSSSPTFASDVMRERQVDSAASTESLAMKLEPDTAESHDGDPELPNAPATDGDTFSGLQWDMRQIDAPEAHEVTGGSPSVITGIIDTGVDKDHPDIVENIDFARSASCESGAPVQDPAAWDDRAGHGTHVAGTVAAPDNGMGVVGVAPNTKIAAIKSSNDDGFFFPEMIICSFMWAGQQRLDVVNNSYFADPYLYNCRNEPTQRAIWKAESRAIKYAMNQGVTVVTSAGNESDDMAHPDVDETSPDYPPGNEETRDITNACVKIPAEIPGVITVTATGNTRQTDDDDDPDDFLKSFYSSYGVGVVDVTAPGGDSVFGQTAESANGRVLSTWPQELPCTRREEDVTAPTSSYCYLQGTSMAAPHVSGVAALVISVFGDLDSPQNGKMRPSQVSQYIEHTSDPQPCPTALPAGYEDFARPGGAPQECQGGEGYNSWYGNGQVNALRAIMHDTGS